jgi:hypothetical protein
MGGRRESHAETASASTQHVRATNGNFLKALMKSGREEKRRMRLER